MLLSLLLGVMVGLRAIFRRLFGGKVTAVEGIDPLPAATNEIKFEDTDGDLIEATECGHYSYEIVIFHLYGRSIRCPGTTLCMWCLLEKAKQEVIPCAKCGLPILPGDHVLLYKKGDHLKYTDRAVKVGDDGFIGCLDIRCGGPEALVFAAGTWNGEKGFVPYHVYTSSEKI